MANEEIKELDKALEEINVEDEQDSFQKRALDFFNASKKRVQDEYENIKNSEFWEVMTADLSEKDAKEVEEKEAVIAAAKGETFYDKRVFANKLTDNYQNDELIKMTQLIFYRNCFNAIVTALDARDEYTAHHSERVSIMAERFCKALCLLPWQTMLVSATASIHDIGKVGTSDSTLKKPGALTNEEWQEMQYHTVQGAEMILKVDPNLLFFADGIKYHHERWNGTGYPEHLKGEEIPYPARIIALCDSTDAMLSSRCYRKHLTEEICKEELEKNAGTMYQPELVKVFLDNWDSIVGDLYKDVE